MAKYSDPHADRTEWDVQDHEARFFVQVWKAAVEHVGGIFYDKTFGRSSEDDQNDEMERRLFQIYKRLRRDLAPEKIKQSIAARLLGLTEKRDAQLLGQAPPTHVYISSSPHTTHHHTYTHTNTHTLHHHARHDNSAVWQ